MGRLSWIIWAAQCHHKGPHERETASGIEWNSILYLMPGIERVSVRDRMEEALLLVLDMEERATSHGMLDKAAGEIFPLKPSQGMQPHQSLDFCPVRPGFGHLTSSTITE